MKRNSYLSRNKSKNSSKNAIQRNSRRRSSIICINQIRQNTRITPTVPKRKHFLIMISIIKKELTARKTRTEREKHRQQRYVHASHISIQKHKRMAKDPQIQGKYPLIASTQYYLINNSCHMQLACPRDFNGDQP